MKRKERKAAEAAAREHAAIEQHRAELTEYLDEARSFEGVTASEVGTDCPVALKTGEHVYFMGAGGTLIEPRRSAGQWQGRSSGVSVRVPGTKSMRYRVGATRGQFVQGEERPTPIDTGVVVITDQRAVFMGANQTREWSWTKLIGVTHASDAPWTAISVSNRQKTSGFAYNSDISDEIRFRLDLAISRALGTTNDVVAHIEHELDALPAPEPAQPSAVAPAAPAAPTTSATPTTTTTLPPPPSSAAAWEPDPLHRHQYRYWDGERWTAYVADNGQQTTDPIDA